MNSRGPKQANGRVHENSRRGIHDRPLAREYQRKREYNRVIKDEEWIIDPRQAARIQEQDDQRDDYQIQRASQLQESRVGRQIHQIPGMEEKIRGDQKGQWSEIHFDRLDAFRMPKREKHRANNHKPARADEHDLSVKHVF